MDSIERLRQDHDILRAKLRLLEYALRIGPEARYVLRELCYNLGSQLRIHIQREEVLILSSQQALAPEILTHLTAEHHDEPQLLHDLIGLFAQDVPPTWMEISSKLKRFITELRRHLAEEELTLFPILPRGAHLQETMTLNRVIHEYPRTRAIFNEMSIDMASEGCDCLDEIAWRHGIDPGKLLARLETAIPQPRVDTAARNE